MNASTVADVLLIGAAVIWVLARQVKVARAKPRLLVLAPLVLAFFGIRSLPASTWRMPADLALLAVTAALSLMLGAWRGQTMIAARGLLYGVGVAVGHRDASDLGAVLVTLALSFAAQNTVTALRMTPRRRCPPTSRRAASRLSQPPAAARPSRRGWLLTIASIPAGTNASKPAGRSDENAAKRGARSDARADAGRVTLCPRAGGAAPGLGRIRVFRVGEGPGGEGNTRLLRSGREPAVGPLLHPDRERYGPDQRRRPARGRPRRRSPEQAQEITELLERAGQPVAYLVHFGAHRRSSPTLSGTSPSTTSLGWRRAAQAMALSQ